MFLHVFFDFIIAVLLIIATCAIGVGLGVKFLAPEVSASPVEISNQDPVTKHEGGW